MDMLQAGCIIGLMKRSHKINCWYVDKYLFVTNVLLGMGNGPILIKFWQIPEASVKGEQGGGNCPPLFGKIEGAAAGGATPHFYL